MSQDSLITPKPIFFPIDKLVYQSRLVYLAEKSEFLRNMFSGRSGKILLDITIFSYLISSMN